MNSSDLLSHIKLTQFLTTARRPNRLKRKGKAAHVPKHKDMKAHKKNGDKDSHIIFKLSNRWRWTLRFTLLSLYPLTNSLWYMLDRKLGWPHSRSGRVGEEVHPVPLRNQTPIVHTVPYNFIDWVHQGTELNKILWIRMLDCFDFVIFKLKKRIKPFLSVFC
jgi:hypothetical protein